MELFQIISHTLYTKKLFSVLVSTFIISIWINVNCTLKVADLFPVDYLSGVSVKRFEGRCHGKKMQNYQNKQIVIYCKDYAEINNTLFVEKLL